MSGTTETHIPQQASASPSPGGAANTHGRSTRAQPQAGRLGPRDATVTDVTEREPLSRPGDPGRQHRSGCLTGYVFLGGDPPKGTCRSSHRGRAHTELARRGTRTHPEGGTI